MHNKVVVADLNGFRIKINRDDGMDVVGGWRGWPVRLGSNNKKVCDVLVS